MNTLIWSSEAASDAYAQRIAREASRLDLGILGEINNAVEPAWEKIVKQGKLSRRDIQPVSTEIVRRLATCKNLVDVRYSRTRSSPLSSNERHTLRMIITVVNPAERHDRKEFEFIACEITVLRNRIEVRIELLNFTATPHVLARYVQRGRSDSEGFFGDIMRPIRTATLLSFSAHHHENNRIILPHGGGFLMGNVVGVRDPTEEDEETRTFPYVVRRDAHGMTSETVECCNARGGLRSFVEAWSFVDADSASGAKLALYERMLAWEREHDEAIKIWFELRAFGSVGLTSPSDEPLIPKRIHAAIEGAKALAESPEWERFARLRDQ